MPLYNGYAVNVGNASILQMFNGSQNQYVLSSLHYTFAPVAAIAPSSQSIIMLSSIALPTNKIYIQDISVSRSYAIRFGGGPYRIFNIPDIEKYVQLHQSYMIGFSSAPITSIGTPAKNLDLGMIFNTSNSPTFTTIPLKFQNYEYTPMDKNYEFFVNTVYLTIETLFENFNAVNLNIEQMIYQLENELNIPNDYLNDFQLSTQYEIQIECS